MGVAATLTIRFCALQTTPAPSVARVPRSEPRVVARAEIDPTAIPEERAELPVASAPESAAPSQTAREFLASYHGARWPEIEAKIEAAGGGLDVPYRFTPWDQVEADFEAQMRPSDGFRERRVSSWLDWAEPLTAEFLAERFPVPGAEPFHSGDLSAIDALVTETNQRIRQRAEFLADLVEQEVRRKWLTGDFVKAPFTTKGLNTAQGFYTRSTGGHGWAVGLTLTYEEYPEYATIQDEMHVLRDEREAKVAEYLRAKYGR